MRPLPALAPFTSPELAGPYRCCLSRLEAFPAKDRAALRGAEWHCGLPTALGTVGRRLNLAVTAAAAPFLALAFAWLAPLRLVPEVLVMKKLLFSGREHELATAIDTLQYSILKIWHLTWLPFPRRRTALGTLLSRPALCTATASTRNPGDSFSGFASGPRPA